MSAAKEIATVFNAEQSMISVIERIAKDPNADIGKLERLLDMQERIMAKQSEMEFFAALNRAQSKICTVTTNRKNEQTRSHYATYDHINRMIRPIYVDEGLSLSFDTEAAGENMVRVICYVSHTSGYTKKYGIDMPADGKGAKGGDVMTRTHATGSATSYGRRYLLNLIFNIAIGEADDDGNGATGQEQFITQQQIAQLNMKCIETGITTKELCDKAQVSDISEIHKERFQGAMNWLNKMGAKA